MDNAQTLDLEDLSNADSKRFYEILDELSYRMYRTVRITRRDRPLSYFEPLGWPMEQLVRLENRFQRELKA